jgi:hypothetical protein
MPPLLPRDPHQHDDFAFRQDVFSIFGGILHSNPAAIRFMSGPSMTSEILMDTSVIIDGASWTSAAPSLFRVHCSFPLY